MGLKSEGNQRIKKKTGRCAVTFKHRTLWNAIRRRVDCNTIQYCAFRALRSEACYYGSGVTIPVATNHFLFFVYCCYFLQKLVSSHSGYTRNNLQWTRTIHLVSLWMNHPGNTLKLKFNLHSILTVLYVGWYMVQKPVIIQYIYILQFLPA
jgi:hypothetical protein